MAVRLKFVHLKEIMPTSPSPKRNRVAGHIAAAAGPRPHQPAARSAPPRKPQSKGPAALPAPRSDALKRVRRAVSKVASSSAEQRMLKEIKANCASAGLAVKRNSLWRIGIDQLGAMSVETLRGVLASLPPLKKKRSKK